MDLIQHESMYLPVILVHVIHILSERFFKYLSLNLMDVGNSYGLSGSETLRRMKQVESILVYLHSSQFSARSFLITTVILVVAAFPRLRDQTPARCCLSPAAASSYLVWWKVAVMVRSERPSLCRLWPIILRTLRTATAEPCPRRDPGGGTGEDTWISLSDESRSGPALWRLLKRPIFGEWVKKKCTSWLQKRKRTSDSRLEGFMYARWSSRGLSVCNFSGQK